MKRRHGRARTGHPIGVQVGFQVLQRDQAVARDVGAARVAREDLLSQSNDRYRMRPGLFRHCISKRPARVVVGGSGKNAVPWASCRQFVWQYTPVPPPVRERKRPDANGSGGRKAAKAAGSRGFAGLRVGRGASSNGARTPGGKGDARSVIRSKAIRPPGGSQRQFTEIRGTAAVSTPLSLDAPLAVLPQPLVLFATAGLDAIKRSRAQSQPARPNTLSRIFSREQTSGKNSATNSA